MEVSFNPATGAGEVVSRGSGNNNYGSSDGSHEGPSLQEKADFWSKNARDNTARHLAERELGSRTDVGGRGVNLDTAAAEQTLLANQRALTDAQGRGDHLEVERLQLLVEQQAQALVTGTPQQNLEEAKLEKQYDQERSQQFEAEAIDELAADPKTQETFNWASQTFDKEVIETFNERLDGASASDSRELTTALNKLQQNDQAYVTGVEPSQMGELSQATIGWFSQNYSPEIADQVNTIATAVRTGLVTKERAMKTVLQSKRLTNAMFAAAQSADVDFKLSL